MSYTDFAPLAEISSAMLLALLAYNPIHIVISCINNILKKGEVKRAREETQLRSFCSENGLAKENLKLLESELQNLQDSTFEELVIAVVATDKESLVVESFEKFKNGLDSGNFETEHLRNLNQKEKNPTREKMIKRAIFYMHGIRKLHRSARFFALLYLLLILSYLAYMCGIDASIFKAHPDKAIWKFIFYPSFLHIAFLFGGMLLAAFFWWRQTTIFLELFSRDDTKFVDSMIDEIIKISLETFCPKFFELRSQRDLRNSFGNLSKKSR